MPREDVVVVIVGTLSLGYALQVSSGFYHPIALVLLTIAIGCAALALMGLPGRLVGDRAGEAAVVGVLAIGLTVNFVMLATMPIAFYLGNPAPSAHPQFLAGLAVAFVLLTLIIVDPSRASRGWFPLLLVTFAALGVWMIRSSPNPHIDVITVHRAAIAAFANGQSPYSVTFENIYANKEFYSPEMVREGRVLFGLPYPPLSLLMAIPGQALLGDIRFAEVGALVLGSMLIGYCTATRVSMLSAALVLFTPRVFFVVEQAWTEAFAVCWLGATVFALCQRAGGGPVALGLLCAVKQHLIIAMALYPIADQSWRRALLIAASIAVLVTVPFALWDPIGVFRSVVWLQFVEPFRLDSLSLLSFLARSGLPISTTTSTVASLGALIVSGLFAWRTAPRTSSGFALALGFVLLILFAFSKKAFCNYYFFVIAAFAASIAASPKDVSSPDAWRTSARRSLVHRALQE
jgi:hypothetical protein